MTNALAYYDVELTTLVKCFIVQSPDVRQRALLLYELSFLSLQLKKADNYTNDTAYSVHLCMRGEANKYNLGQKLVFIPDPFCFLQTFCPALFFLLYQVIVLQCFGIL